MLTDFDYPHIEGAPLFVDSLETETAMSLMPILKAIMLTVPASSMHKLHPYAHLPFPTLLVPHEELDDEKIYENRRKILAPISRDGSVYRVLDVVQEERRVRGNKEIVVLLLLWAPYESCNDRFNAGNREWDD